MAGLVAAPLRHTVPAHDQLRATFSAEAFEATAYVALSAVDRHDRVLGHCCRRCSVGAALLVVALAGLPLIVAGVRVRPLLAALRAPPRGGALLGVDFPTRHLPRDGNWLNRALRWLGSRGAVAGADCYALVALPFVGWIGAAWSSSPGAPRSRC